MRPVVILFVLAGLLVACGGDDEYTSKEGAKAPDAGTPTPDKPKEPEKPKPPPMSAEAQAVQAQYTLIKNERSPDRKKSLALDAAQKHAGSAGDALFFLGLLYQMAQEYEQAADAFVKFTSACPTDVNHKNGLFYAAECLAQCDKAEDAVSYVEELATKYQTEPKLIQVAGTKVGTGLLSEGKFAKAASMFKNAVDAGSKYAGLSFVEALWALGKFDEARTQAKALLDEFEGTVDEKHYKALSDRASKVGNPAPNLVVDGWSDDSFAMDELQADVYMVYFWDMRKLGMAKGIERRLTTLFDRYREEKFMIIGLSRHSKYDLVAGNPAPDMSTEDELKQLKTWVFNYKAPWMYGLVADKTNHDALGFWATPHFAIVDAKGLLRFARSGGADADYKILSKVIEKCLDEAE
jgi:tetratricopeptide (TPR) repeat protein